MPVRHNGTYLDDESLDVLRYVWKHDRCSTRDITVSEEVELEDNDRIRYRFERIEEAGLAEVSTAEYSEGGGHPPKQITLTDEGVQEVQRGLLGDVFESDATVDMEKERLKKRVAELEDRIDWLEEQQQDLIPVLVGFRETMQANDMKPLEYVEEAKENGVTIRRESETKRKET